MSRRYQAFQKAGGLTALDSDLSADGMLDTGGRLPDTPVRPPQDMTRAVADLLQDKLLTHRFGVQEEWEVRTTILANRQIWRYRSRVFVHGKELRKDFPSIAGDRTRQLRLAETVGADMLTAFAREAVEVHFVRCASVAEYIRMGPSPASPRRRSAHLKALVLVLCAVVALVIAYGLWKGSELRSEQRHPGQPERIAPPPEAIAPSPEPIAPPQRLPGHWTW